MKVRFVKKSTNVYKNSYNEESDWFELPCEDIDRFQTFMKSLGYDMIAWFDAEGMYHRHKEYEKDRNVE